MSKLLFFMVLIIGGLAAPVLAQNNTVTVGDLQFTIDQTSQTARLSGKVACPNGELVIPDHVEDDGGQQYPVTSIGNYVFQNCQQLTSITFPSSLTSIGNYVFQNCQQLTSITFPSSLTSIGEKAFNGCTSLSTLTIPSSVNSIGTRAFQGCTSLSSVQYNATSCNIPRDYSIFEDCTHEAVLTIGDNVTSVPQRAFRNFLGLKTIFFPSSLTTIGNNSFYGCSSLVSIVLPPQLQTIGSNAFENCRNLEEITIPSSVTAVGNYTFSGCTMLTAVHYQGTIAQWCNISFEQFYSNPISMAHNLYIGDNLVEHLIIPQSVVEIKRFAFQNATCLQSVSFEAPVTTRQRAFEGCTNLTGVYFTGTLAQWCSNNFDKSYVNDNNLYWTSNPLYLAHHLYINGVLSEGHLIIPDEVTAIGRGCFAGGEDWEDITIGSGVMTIGDGVFWGCTATTLHYNCNSLSTNVYNSQEREKGYYLFRSLTALDNVVIGENVTTLPAYVFQLTCLKSIILPPSIERIGNNAFDGCSDFVVYNLSDMPISTSTYGMTNATIFNCSKHGSGENAIRQIPAECKVDDEAVEGFHIPESVVPDNFIYSSNNGNTWKAKRIVLTDGQESFLSPVDFTADEAVYTRDLTDGNRSTLCLPFHADKPADLDVYTFADYNSSTQTIRFQELQDNELTAYTPYLVGYGISHAKTNCEIIQENALFPATPTPIATSTINGLTFLGTMERECMNSTNYGYKDGYFVQSSAGTQGDHTSHAHVNPFRCYFTLSGSQNAPATLSVDTDGDYLGIEEVDGNMEQTAIRYSNDVYDMMGRLVRKNADNLRGLPRGIYIWRGKKQIAY